jgi:hypothetical protein
LRSLARCELRKNAGGFSAVEFALPGSRARC